MDERDFGLERRGLLGDEPTFRPEIVWGWVEVARIAVNGPGVYANAGAGWDVATQEAIRTIETTQQVETC